MNKPVKLNKLRTAVVQALFVLMGLLNVFVGRASPAPSPAAGSLWAHDRLVPWVAGVYDKNKLGPEERARTLKRLGFSKFAYFWEPDRRNIREIDAEIEALKNYGIEPVAWWFSYDAADPFAKALLESFKRHNIHPQLWVSPTYCDREADAAKFLPKGVSIPSDPEGFQSLSEKDSAAIGKAFEMAYERYMSETFAKTPQEQAQRINQEAAKIQALAILTKSYGSEIALYNQGIPDVRIVYAFNHVRDAKHDDRENFPVLWSRIQRHVVAVTITGICMDDGSTAYPSQGDGELEMMRTIQKSGWKGQVGVFAGDWNTGADAETSLKNILLGMDWLAAELKQPGSGGPHPFPTIPLAKSESH